MQSAPIVLGMFAPSLLGKVWMVQVSHVMCFVCMLASHQDELFYLVRESLPHPGNEAYHAIIEEVRLVGDGESADNAVRGEHGETGRAGRQWTGREGGREGAGRELGR